MDLSSNNDWNKNKEDALVKWVEACENSFIKIENDIVKLQSTIVLLNEMFKVLIDTQKIMLVRIEELEERSKYDSKISNN